MTCTQSGIGRFTGSLALALFALMASLAPPARAAGMLVADWKEYCVLTGVEFRDNKRIAQNYSVHFFVSVNNWIDQAKTQGEERIEAWTVGDVGRVIPTVYHLTWLIPMAISHWRLQDAPAFEVTEVNR